jgi:iron-sulfur cluster repair protein YtfE (RIC family)
MIRHEAIAELSRDHHQALMEAIKLKRASDETAEQVAADFVAFFDDECQHHFMVEEQVLLPLYAKFAGLETAVDPLVIQMLHEHVELRALVEELRAGDAGAQLVRELGQRLDGHVRHEERKLFPKIQGALSDDQLSELAVAVAQAEAQPSGPE